MSGCRHGTAVPGTVDVGHQLFDGQSTIAVEVERLWQQVKPFYEAIATRRSITHVSHEPVPRALLEELLTAACWAPNHKLTEPWRFVVMTGGARVALGEAHADAVGAEGAAREGQVALTERAPVVIACLSKSDAADPVRRRGDRDAVAAAIQNLLLAAHARNLGAIWRTGAFCDEEPVRIHLGAGPGDDVVGFVYLGWPEQIPETPTRRGVSDVTEWRS